MKSRSIAIELKSPASSSRYCHRQRDFKKLVDVRVETPIAGISTRKRKGNDFVWVGKEYTRDGWLLKEEYDKINNLNNK